MLDISINKKFKGIHNVDIIVTLKHKMRFLYSITHNVNDLTFLTILNSPWYYITIYKTCKFCSKYDKYYGNHCIQCYNFSYNTIYYSQFIKYTLIKQFLLIDISNIIMTDILHLLGYQEITTNSFNYKKITKICTNNKPIIEDHDLIIEDHDLITEDNMNKYVGGFYDDSQSIDDYEGLGTWSDDDNI